MEKKKYSIFMTNSVHIKERVCSYAVPIKCLTSISYFFLSLFHDWIEVHAEDLEMALLQFSLNIAHPNDIENLFKATFWRTISYTVTCM